MGISSKARSAPISEATFVLCSFWLVDNLVATGQAERGRELFERLDEDVAATDQVPRHSGRRAAFVVAPGRHLCVGAALERVQELPPSALRRDSYPNRFH